MKTNSEIHILIVDDDKDDHFFIKRALKRVIPDSLTTSVYDGTEAIDYLLKRGDYESNNDKLPDIIFMDINMPKMNGKNATALLKKEKNLNTIPIVIFTTSSNPADRDQLLSIGACDYYIKPYDINVFVQILETVKTKWLTSFLVAGALFA